MYGLCMCHQLCWSEVPVVASLLQQYWIYIGNRPSIFITDEQENSASPSQTPPVVTDEKGSLPLAAIGGAVGAAVVVLQLNKALCTEVR